jgi:hypothetical protein
MFRVWVVDGQGPPDSDGNRLRGWLGASLRRRACRPECSDPARCPDRTACSYARFFEGATAKVLPSGFAQPPRPFVLRAIEANGRYRLHVFDPDPYWREAIEPVGIEERVVEPVVEVASGLTVEFLTPTELKFGGALAPEGAAFIARARDRVAMLAWHYQGLQALFDSARIAEEVEGACWETEGSYPVAGARTSRRTGQTHPLRGFVGTWRARGRFCETLRLLRFAEWTGVGRQTVWGHGRIRVTALE